MGKKIKKTILLLACTVSVMGAVTGVYASTKGINAELTETYLGVSFNYGEVGHTLKVEATYTEKHTGTGQIFSKTEGSTAFGNNTSVSYSRNPHTGYKFTGADFAGYVDGCVYTTLENVTP